MRLDFYNCSAPPNKLAKSLTSLGSTSYFEPFYQASELNPQYVLSELLPDGANYVYDDYTKSYYFITDIIHDIAKTTTINCSLDPLMSFSGRLTGNFYFVRGAKEVNEMEDASYPLSDYINTETFYLDDWDSSFFQNNDGSTGGKRYMLRVAHGNSFDDDSAVDITSGQVVQFEGRTGTITSITDGAVVIQLQSGLTPTETIDEISILQNSGVLYYYSKTQQEGGITNVIFTS